MADNSTLPGVGDVYASEDRGGVKFQKVLVGPLDGAGYDAFGRGRTSHPATIFDSKLLAADDQPLLWNEALESGGGITASTPTAEKPYTDFASTLNTAGVFTRQTFRRFNYQPGKSQMMVMTGVLDLTGGGTGVERRIGAFDDNNGMFFEDDAGTIGVTVRSNDSGSPVDTTVAQASWNLDNLDGGDDAANPSGITADWTKSQIFLIDYQWLGVGRIRFGVVIGGVVVYVHETSNANTLAIPTTSTPNLPVRYQIVTTGSSPASTMRCICVAVISEGGDDSRGVPHSAATVAHVDADVADTVYAVVGVRLKSAALGCGFSIINVSMLSETSDNFEWQVIHNPTVAGTFTYGDLTNSCCQTALGATANSITNGTIMARGFGATSSSITNTMESELSLGAAIDGTQDEVVLAVRPLGANADIQGSVNWLEKF